MFNVQSFLLMFNLLMFSMVFDWMFQTNDQATNKFKHWEPRLAHSVIYAGLTFIMLVTFGIGSGIAFFICLLLGITHFFIDDRRAVIWWMLRIKKIPRSSVLPGQKGEWPTMWWMQIGLDQCFHFVVNFLLAVIFARL